MITIRFFAALRDIVGKDEIQVQADSGASVQVIFEKLVQEYPPLNRYKSVLLIAVNQEFSDWSRSLEAGDELALFPPVSGGLR